jgi:hypothetical protein
MFEVRTETILLGEREYVIREAGHKKSSAWRYRLMTEIRPIFEQVSGISDIKFETPSDLMKLVPVAEQLFVNGIDQIYELLLDYSDDLRADQEYIQNNATDRQIFFAFQKVIGLADFFGIVPQIRKIGLVDMIGTSSKSQSVNGASPSKKRKS